MLRRVVFVAAVLFSLEVRAQSCPGADDEPTWNVKTKAGPSLVVCGFEDHEVGNGGGKRAFSEFSIYSWAPGGKAPQKIFSSEPSETYWLSAPGDRAMELEELWFFDDKPHPAVSRTITCSAASCQISPARCILRLQKKEHPKALDRLQKTLKRAGDEGEVLLEQVWAMALTGDKAAARFFDSKPAGLDPELSEDFEADRQKLRVARELKCPSLQPSNAK